MKAFATITTLFTLLSSTESSAQECVRYFKNNNIVIVNDSSTAQAFGALIGPGLLSAALIQASLKPGQEKVPTPSKNQRHISLSQFLSDQMAATPQLNLDTMDLKYLPSSDVQNKCTIIFTSSHSVIDNYDSSHRQIFRIQRTSNGAVDYDKFITVTSYMKVYPLQPKPRKILKEDTRTGKYIDVSKKMIDENIYNKTVFEEFAKSFQTNVSTVAEKYKTLPDAS